MFCTNATHASLLLTAVQSIEFPYKAFVWKNDDKVVALVVDDVDRVQVHCCSLFRVLMRHVSQNKMVQGAQITGQKRR